MKIPISARGLLQRTGFALVALGLTFQINAVEFASGQEKPKSEQSASGPQEADSSKALPNGIEVRHAGMLLQVLALREDVLRLRLSPKGELPEDASWAVPVEVRHQRVEVTPDASPDSVGFHTKTLNVRIERTTLRLSTTDLSGNVLQEDAEGWLPEFHSDAFRVYKKMPMDEHYFGLGDKVGPLDRRGQSFRLWNTDAFCFQESTDPIYKSIPFFMTMRARRSPLCGLSAFSNPASVTRPKLACAKLHLACGPTRFPPMCSIWTLTFRRNIVRSPWIRSASHISSRCCPTSSAKNSTLSRSPICTSRAFPAPVTRHMTQESPPIIS